MVELLQMVGIGLTFSIATSAFSLSLYFINKLLRSHKTTREILPFLGLALIFLFSSIAFIMVAFFDYFRWENGVIIFELHKIHSILILSSVVALLFLFETVLKKTYYLITLFAAIMIIFNIIFNRSLETSSLFTIFVAAPLGILIIFLWFFVFIKPLIGFLRFRVVFSLFGYILMTIGSFLRDNSLVELFGFQIYLIGSVGTLFGLFLVGYGFSAFSSLTDLNWKRKLREFFIISNGGICLYAYSFEQKRTINDSDLVAGGFSGIQTLLSEMIKTNESLQLINYQNVKIILEQREGVMFVLILKEDSTFLPYKLKIFAEEFTNFFREIIKHWRGEIEVFSPTRYLIQRIFEVDSHL